MDVAAARLVSGEGTALCAAADPFSLAEANINPVTGLSTDYLNHFNEAAMLLDMIPMMPECRADLREWRPLSYQEHFAGSHLIHRELAIAAYDLADAFTRRQFDDLCGTMNATVLAVRDAMESGISDRAAAAIAERAGAWLKPLIARASAVIHGFDSGAGDTASIQEFQAAVDAVLDR